MLQAPAWRKLLYELSAKHKDSLLLNYAIQRISEDGHQNEIASLPAANTYFPVYNRVLDYAFGEVVQMSEDELFNFLPEFTTMCNHGEHTYLYAQALSYMLAGEPGGDIFRRLSQELERDVADKYVRRCMNPIPVFRSPLHQRHHCTETGLLFDKHPGVPGAYD
jgi:negative elongation factor C/D